MTREQIIEIVKRFSKNNYCDYNGRPISTEEKIASEILKLKEEKNSVADIEAEIKRRIKGLNTSLAANPNSKIDLALKWELMHLLTWIETKQKQ